MDVMTWLLKGNENIIYLTNKYLLDIDFLNNNDGYIKKYLSLYNDTNKMWGNGLYGPKWISSTYTLLELINLDVEIDQRMIDAYDKLSKEIVIKYTLNPKNKRTLDLCIVGMLIRIGSYLNTDQSNLKELIDFVLHTIHSDGAWNCYFNYRTFQTSSLHTTINVLEGLLEYTNKEYTYRRKEIEDSMKSAHEFILKKKLFKSRRTDNTISEQITKIHYPTRWFYDMYRVLEYFVNASVKYDTRMKDALDIVVNQINKGPMPKGRMYAGRLHFSYDLEDYKRINTLRTLRIIKFYKPETYNIIMNNQIFKK